MKVPFAKRADQKRDYLHPDSIGDCFLVITALYFYTGALLKKSKDMIPSEIILSEYQRINEEVKPTKQQLKYIKKKKMCPESIAALEKSIKKQTAANCLLKNT